MEAKFGTYWVARISFRKTNPEHSYIVRANGSARFEVLGGESKIEVLPNELRIAGGSFRLIRQINMEEDEAMTTDRNERPEPRSAWDDLVFALGESLGVPRLLDCLTAFINRRPRLRRFLERKAIRMERP